MSTERRDRLDHLLRKSRRSKRVPQVAAEWEQLDVAVSPVADSRHERFLDRLRSGGSWSLDYTPDFKDEVTSFVKPFDLVALTGWDVREEPVVLIGTADLRQHLAKLPVIYADGFVIGDSTFASFLIVDWDEERQSAYSGIFKLDADAPNH